MTSAELAIHDGLVAACNTFHERAFKAGWWDEDREIGTCLALIHSEVSEALEAARRDALDAHLPLRSGLEVELADAVIRICDLAGRYGLDLAGAVIDKSRYNMERADHKKETRVKRF